MKKILLFIPLLAMALTASSACTLTVSISGTTPACGSVTLTANPSNAQGTVHYQWSAGGGTGASATFSTAGTYTVSVTATDDSCSMSSSKSITVNANPVITGSTFSVCINSTINLTGSGTPNGTTPWVSGSIGVATVSNSGVVSGVSHGTSLITYTDNNGCQATQNVTVNSLPSVTINGTDSGCGSVPLAAVGSGGSGGGYSYTWSAGSSPNTAANTFSDTGTYHVTVTDGNGCTGSTSKSVTQVFFQPSPLITPGGPTSFCAGGNVLLTAPSSGNAVNFSSGGYVSGTGPDVSTGNFTVEAWIFPLAGTKGVIVAQGGITCSSNGYALLFNNDSLILQTVSGGACQNPGTIKMANALVLNQWQHVAASVIRGTTGNFTKLFVDGMPVDSGNIAAGSLTNTSLTIGGASGGTNFNGLIDEVRIYNTALSQSAIQTAMYSIIPQNSPNLVTYYRFDEGTGTTTADLASGGSGTFHGSLGWQVPSSSPVGENIGEDILYNWSTGSVGQGVEISAAGSYVVRVTSAAHQICTASDTIAVSLNAVPVISIDSVGPYCIGNNISLALSGNTTYNSYSWSGPDAFTSSASAPSVTDTSSVNGGEYTVTVTDGNGCTATTYRVITVNALPIPNVHVTAQICTGSSLSLTASGGFTYVWSGPNSFSSHAQDTTLTNVTSPAHGTYTVTVTNAQGCTATASSSDTVNPLPTPSASSSNTPVCEGSTLDLSATGGSSYSWSGPDGYHSFGSSVFVTDAGTAATGAYTVTATDSHGCTATATVSATVNALPPANAGNNGPVCIGTTLNLIGSGITIGGSYQWSGPNGFTSGAQDTSIVGVALADSGTYSVTVTDNSSHCSASASTSVSISSPPVPNISVNGPICAGNNLSFSSDAADQYSWSGPNSFTSTDQNPIIVNATSAATGVYNITVTENGCSASATVSATVYALPAATATNSTNGINLCSGETIDLMASGGTDYVWSGPIGFSSTQQSPVINNAGALASGTYTVTVTDAHCAATASTTLTVVSVPAAAISGLNGPICTGETLDLTADGGIAYSWSGPNGFAASSEDAIIHNITLSDSGVYTVTVTNSGNCSATAATDVSVNIQPAFTFCPGNLTQNAANGQCSATVNFAATASGSPAADIWYSQNPGTVYSVGTTAILVNASNICGAVTCSFNVTVVDNQPPAFTCPGNINVIATQATCSSAQTITTPTVTDNCGVVGIVNSFNGTANASGTYPVGTTDVVWTATDFNGNTTTCTQVITIQPCISLSGTAINTLCPGTFLDSIITSVSGGAGSYTYLWSNGSTTANLYHVAAGTYTVTVTDAAHSTISASFTIETVIPPVAPAAPASISGAANICLSGTGTYSIAAVPSTVSYYWTVPSTASITSGQGTASITVSFPSNYTNGNITVAAVNCVGSSPNAQLAVNHYTAPGNLGAIQGSNTVCKSSTYTYTVNTNPPPPPGPNNAATTYSWTAPANATIISGQGTSTVTIQYASNFSSGTLSVVGGNCAGNSPASSLNITLMNGATLPGVPNDVDEYPSLNDPTGACPGDTISYTLFNDAPQANTTGFTWTAPAGAVIIAGQGTQVVTIVYLAGFTGGTISVVAFNCAGSSAASTQSIPSGPAPPSPAPNPVSTRNYQNQACPGDTLVYSITAVVGAQTYTWTLPSNTQLVSGQGTATITFVALAAYSGGTLSVYASNCGGSGPSASVALTIADPPGNPGPVKGSSAVCPGFVYTYSVTASNGDIQTYAWNLPSGASIVSGLGTTTIGVLFQPGFTSGIISVSAFNCLGYSNTQSMSVALATQVPGGTNIPGGPNANVCINNVVVYTAQWVNGATSYTWTPPAFTTILSGQGSTSITLKIDTGYTGGPLKVYASNCVGNGNTFTLNLTHNNCGADGGETAVNNITGAPEVFNVMVYPNPFTGQFHIKVSGAGTEPVNMTMFDITGKTVEENYNIAYDQEIIVGSRLPSGVYLLRVIQGDNIKVLRLVKAE